VSAWLGIASALILIATTPAYLRHSLSGPTRPHPLSWGIWTGLGILGAVSTTVAGGGASVIALYTAATLTLLVFVVALRQHDWRISRSEYWPILPAAAGLIVWIVSQDPLAATIGVVVADSSAGWPTLRKTWRAPRSEPPLVWATDAFAFLLGCLSVSSFTLAAMLYPVYLTLTCALIALVAWLRRGQVTAPQASAEAP
jgi:hypothetical protein